jgi:membrane-bound serine protease (ClpP class)
MAALGIALLLAGAVLLVAEVHITSGGLLGTAGTAAAVGGTVLAVQAAGGGLVLALVLALVVAIAAGGLVLVAARAVSRSSRGRVRSGREALVGCHGRARTDLTAGEGRVLVDGALWRARNAFPDDPVAADAEIVVVGVDGLTLTVRSAESWELNP